MRSGKTALVLSAGGMFGAYQAGAWEVLSEAVRPDIVIGASIGALNGWMIAGGASGRELVREWLQPPNALEARFLSRRIVEEQVRRVFDSYRPRVEYGLVATHIPSLEPKLFRTPGLTWKHLACSTAIPLIFRHHRLDGRLYSDGGLMLPLPLWAAAEMGATEVIGIDLLPQRPPYLEAMARAARWISRFAPPDSADLRVTMVSPSRRLGSVWDSIHWSPERMKLYVETGRADAQAALPFLAREEKAHHCET